MILPAGVQQSITKNNIDISTGWMFASFPIWNLDYSAQRPQPVSMEAVPLADLRFLDPTVTLVIRQSASPTSLVLWSGVAVMDDDTSGGGGGGTPNVAIAGTDASGKPIASPVLIGNAMMDSVMLDGGNTNTGFHGVVFGGGNDNTGENDLVAGYGNNVDGDNGLTVGYTNDAPGNNNLVAGSLNVVPTDNNMVVGGQNVLDLGGGNNSVCGNANSIKNANQSDISGNSHVIERLFQSVVTGIHNIVKNVEDCIVSGVDNVVGALPGLVTKYGIMIGRALSVVGQYQNVFGQLHEVSGNGNTVFGIGHKISIDDVFVSGSYAEIPISGDDLVEIVGGGTSDVDRLNIRTLKRDGQQNVLHSYAVAGTKVVGPQDPGWGLPTGIGTKASFDTATVTHEQLAERVKALTDALLNHGLLGASPVSPLLTSFTYILPTSGSFEEFSRSGAEESFKIRLEPTGPTNTFQTVRIAFPNAGAAYTVERVYLMRSGNANTSITEDPATGVVTVSGVPFVVPAGTDEEPAWYEIAVSVSVGPVSDFVLLIDVASGSPRSDWGSGSYRGLGWIYSATEKLSQNLTSGIDFTGGESFGSMPPVRVKFEGLSTPVLWLPFVGDSWAYGYGDGGGPWRPYGIEGRLNARWDAFNQPIAVMGYGRSGYTTDQSLTRLQNLLANFDCRAACVQFNSLNNVLQTLPDTQCRTDWAGVEAAMGTRKILPLVGGGMLDAFAPGWFTAWKANSDWMVARNADTNADVYDNLVSPTTGVIGVGLAYTDDSHPNTDGYDAWEVDCNANMRSVIAAWGV